MAKSRPTTPGEKKDAEPEVSDAAKAAMEAEKKEDEEKKKKKEEQEAKEAGEYGKGEGVWVGGRGWVGAGGKEYIYVIFIFIFWQHAHAP